MSLIRLLFINF